MDTNDRQDQTEGHAFKMHLVEDTATEAHSMRVHGLVDDSAEDGIHRGGLADDASDSDGHGGRIPFTSTQDEDSEGHVGSHKF